MEACVRDHGYACPLSVEGPAPRSAAPLARHPLEERERSVLDALSLESQGEGDAHVTFQGLRRRLGLHQQALTRTLRRLEDAGLVARDEKGYRPTESGYAATTRASHGDPREVLTVVQALLPPDLDAAAVARRLARRWFHGLRWYGESEAPGETTLTWLSDADGSRIRLRVSGGALTLETEVAPGASERAFASLHALVAALADLYAPRSRDARPAAS